MGHQILGQGGDALRRAVHSVDDGDARLDPGPFRIVQPDRDLVGRRVALVDGYLEP